MTKHAVLDLLRQADGFLSGQQMSQQLHLSRAAIWKAVKALRAEGYEIESATNRGYRLAASTTCLSREEILRHLQDCPWAESVTVLDTVDSTNTLCKKLAAEGAPHGTVVLSDEQTGGRGRMGRSFASPAGVGLYLSVILRPDTPPAQLLHLTAVAAEAAVDAVEQTIGLRPGIKWTNDLVIGRQKLAGILTELSIEAESGMVDYAVIGIGLNCNHGDDDFPPDVRPMAISMREATEKTVDRNALAANLIRSFYQADAQLLTEKEQWLSRYEADCITVGQDVKIVRGDTIRLAHALGIDQDGGLLVAYGDGSRGTVSSGEVSVRGMYGYV